jgi:outer membrane cobalamin receptor
VIPALRIVLLLTVTALAGASESLAAGQEEQTPQSPPSAPPPGGVQPPPPAGVFSDEIVVTASRVEQMVRDVPSSMSILAREEILASSAQTVDGLLSRIPGFSLLRQGSSIVAAPTVRFASLRGLGGSNSRTLVLLNGIPLNEPFSGVIYWSQIPLEDIERVEIVKGGGSGTWGNLALGGVINIITTSPGPGDEAFVATVEGGNAGTARVYAAARGARGRLHASVTTNLFRTGGYYTIREDQKGPVDRRVNDVNGTVGASLEYRVSPEMTWSFGGSYYHEQQDAATRLAEFSTDAVALHGQGTILRPGGSRWQMTGFFSRQNGEHRSSTIGAGRQTETPAGDQFDVPAASVGASVQWSRPLSGRHLVTAGADAQWIDAAVSEHLSFVADRFTRTRTSGGQQTLGGLYVEDIFQVTPRWRISAAARLDRWQAFRGVRRELDSVAQVVLRDDQPDGRTALTFNPSVGVVRHVSDRVSIKASLYRAFRAPTPAEMYRPFRTRGNVIVESNAQLDFERLTGVEGGVDAVLPGSLRTRVTGYWDSLRDSVAAVTIEAAGPSGRTIVPCGFVPAGGVCRQRQNLGRLRSAGIDAEFEGQLGTSWTGTARYLFNRSRVVEVATQPQLAGTFNTQSPVHQVVLAASYQNPRTVNVSLGARYVGARYEDDLNSLRIDDFVTADLRVARAVSGSAEAYVAVQNLFDTTYEVTRAADGTVTVGEPRLVNVGLRVRF